MLNKTMLRLQNGDIQKNDRTPARNAGKNCAPIGSVVSINYLYDAFRFMSITMVLVCLLTTALGISTSWGQGKLEKSEEQDRKTLIRLGYNALFVDFIIKKKSDSLERASVMETFIMAKQKKHTLRSVQLKNKTVKFIPMIHIGQKEFYEDVTSSIQKFRKRGFVVYYEGIGSDGTDSLINDTLSRKLRKMIGLSPTLETYSVLKIFVPDLVPQYSSSAMGILNTDINADITKARLVQQYEQLYGALKLDSCDLNTPLREMYDCAVADNGLPAAVIMDFRNKHLVEKIRNAPHSKILVIYGADHIEPVIDLIKKTAQ